MVFRLHNENGGGASTPSILVLAVVCAAAFAGTLSATELDFSLHAKGETRPANCEAYAGLSKAILDARMRGMSYRDAVEWVGVFPSTPPKVATYRISQVMHAYRHPLPRGEYDPEEHGSRYQATIYQACMEGER